MKKRTKWILGTSASLVVLLCVAGFIYFQFFFTIDMSGDWHLFEEGPVNKVNLAGWKKLEKGMSKEEVANLLGEYGSSFNMEGTSISGKKFTMSEIWEYNWSIGLPLFGEAHLKAYIVRFGPDGKLASWREPVERENDKGSGETD